MIYDTSDSILIARRDKTQEHGGYWEFPGGKREADESSFEALSRELNEELGIEIKRALPLVCVEHRYPKRLVTLETFEVADWTGQPRGREGQKIQWIDRSELSRFEFPAANRATATALKLPRTILITPSVGDDIEQFLQHLGAVTGAQRALVQFRDPHLSDSRYIAIAARVVDVCEKNGTTVMLNIDPTEFSQASFQFGEKSSCVGLHLNRRRLFETKSRPVPTNQLLSASCHDELAIAHANELGVDFIYISPVHQTLSHPSTPALGWEKVAKLARQANMPVFGLGSMKGADLEKAINNRCLGIAAIREFWGGKPDKVAAEISAALNRATLS